MLGLHYSPTYEPCGNLFKIHLEIGAKGSQNNAMTGELLSPAAQGDVTEGVVEPEAIEALQNSTGVSGFHKQVVLARLRD